jgi:hypothetical protein
MAIALKALAKHHGIPVSDLILCLATANRKHAARHD